MPEAKKSDKPKLRRVNKQQAKDILAKVGSLLNKSQLTGDETELSIVELKNVVMFLRDWSRFSG